MTSKIARTLSLLALLATSGSAFAQTSTGTGFFITESGYLVTNNHVIDKATEFQIRDFRGSVFDAKLIRKDSANDLAILKVDGKFSALPIVRSSTVRKADAVFTLGYPNTRMQGFSIKFTEGTISSLAGVRDEPNTFQISVPVQPGNSGGPLINHDGLVVGVVVAKLSASASISQGTGIPEAVNYAVKSNYLYELIDTDPNVSGSLISAEKKKKTGSLAAIVQRSEPSVVLVIAKQRVPEPQRPSPAGSLSGNQGPGEPCETDMECQAGLFCYRMSGSCQKRYQEPIRGGLLPDCRPIQTDLATARQAEQFSVSYHSVRLLRAETCRWITGVANVSSGSGVRIRWAGKLPFVKSQG